MEYLLIGLAAVAVVISIVCLVCLMQLQREVKASRQETLQSVQTTVGGLGQLLSGSQQQAAELQDKRLAELISQLTARNEALQTTVGTLLLQMDERLKGSAMENEQKLENIRNTMENRLAAIQADNGKRLEEMRATVDEKLQKTLETRISQSFQLVNQRLEEVYKGLGEMQTLAVGVGDLKKVLSNIKTRGILGEIQLGAILEEILAPEQYEKDVCTKAGSADRVEYAVKLPGSGEDTVVYLPIDAKFPVDTYNRLLAAYEDGNRAEADLAAIQLERSIRNSAKYIHDKYIDPPGTTDFGILFLPFEGLYAEVVRRGLVETLQRDYKINIAGPTTMAALLNSLQMGFRTLAIQKRSGEVWQTLGAVKTEFGKFDEVLRGAQKRLNLINEDIDKLVGTRTRLMMSKLRGVEKLPEGESGSLLGLDDPEAAALGEAEWPADTPGATDTPGTEGK